MTGRRIVSRLVLAAGLILTGWLAASSSGPASTGGPGTLPYVPGEVLIRFRSEAAETERAGIRASLGARRLRSFARSVEQLRLGRGIDTAQAVERLRGHPAVRYVEPNYLWQVDGLPNDRFFDELYGLRNTGQTGGTPGADIGAEQAWELTTGSGEVVVGVIDSGIDYNHPDLAANIWTHPGEIPGNGRDDDGNGYIDDVHGWDFANDDNDAFDDLGHGTHVAGTIGAVADNGIGVAGVAWKVRLVPLKFIAASGFGSTADAIAAIEYATAIGVEITNNSWGGGAASVALLEAIRASGEAGVLFVAAAGNQGSNTDVLPHYPSSYDVPTILAVTALDHNDARPLFANLGPRTVDLAAPGVNVLSTIPGGVYGFSSGTSMAAPHASGAAALVRSMAREIGPLELKRLLMDHVDRLPNLVPVTVAGGRLNVARSLAERDRVAPGAIAGLSVSAPTSNSVFLAWTATGDDGDSGAAAVYEVRYATFPIDAESFPRALRYWDTPSPATAGSTERLEVTGLLAGASYFFAIRALDEWGNRGPVSSAVVESTLPPPSFASTPERFDLALDAGDTATLSLDLIQAGVGTLDWSVVPDPGTPWLAVSPVAGRLGPGETERLTLVVDTRDQEPGELAGSVDVATNDPLKPRVVHPVIIELASAPAIEISPAAVDFGEVFVGGSRTLPIDVKNFGTEPLTVSEIGTAAPGITVAPASSIVEPGGAETIDVTFSPEIPGLLAGELTVSSDAPSAPSIVVALRGSAAPPPSIEVSPQAIDASVLARTAETRVITIANPGPSPLVVDVRFAAGADSGIPIASPLVNGGFETGDFTGWRATDNDVFGRLDWTVASSGAGLFENSAPFEGTRDALNGFEGGAGLRYDLEQDLAVPAGATRAELSFHDRIQWDDLGFRGQLPRTFEATIEDSNGQVLAVIAREEILFDGTGRHDLGWQRRTVDLLPWAGRTVRLRLRQLLRETLTGPAQMELDAFAIDIEGFPSWLRPSARRVVVAPGSSVDLEVLLDASGLLEADLDAFIRLETNVPARPLLLVPVRMAVSGLPAIALRGQRLEVLSTETFSTSGATTSHVLPLPRSPGGAGTIELIAEADLGDLGESSTLVVEGVPLVAIGNTHADCVNTVGRFDLDPARMSALGADGQVLASVVNSAGVNPVCNPNRHTVRLSYEARADLLDFGTVYRGSVAHLALTIDNPGTAPLEISSVSVDPPDFTPSFSAAVLPVGGSLDLDVAFAPRQNGSLEGQVAIASNDPLAPRLEVRLVGHAVAPPEIVPDPAAVELDLPPGGHGARTLRAGNPGGAPVDFTATIEAVTGEAFVEVLPRAGSIGAGSSVDLELAFDAAQLDPGAYMATLRITGADPATPPAIVPLRLVVAPGPDIALEGRLRTAESTVDFAGSGARTVHALVVDAPPAGEATLRVIVIGDFGAAAETAAVRAEGLFLGTLGGTGQDCIPQSAEFVLGALDLARLAVDGVIAVEVQNTAAVGELCAANLHAARLTWREEIEPLDFGSAFVGFSAARHVVVANRGTLPLDVRSPHVTTGEFSADAEPIVLGPGEARTLEVRFAPTAPGPAAGSLEIASDDPDEPLLSLALGGRGVDPPVLEIDPAALEVTLGAGETTTGGLTLSNVGAAPLRFAAGWRTPAPPFAALAPAAGSLAGGESIDVTVSLDARGLAAGVHAATIVVESDDPARRTVEVPLALIVAGAPSVSLSADALDFGDTPAGGERRRAIEIVNTGTAPLALGSALSDSAEFEPLPLPASLAPHESAWLGVVFRPAALGLRQATLVLSTDDPQRPELQIALRGAGIASPRLSVEPMRVDAVLASGVGGGLERLVIANTGSSPLEVSLLGRPAEGNAPGIPAAPEPPVYEPVAAAPAPVACLVADPAGRRLYALLAGGTRFVRLDAVAEAWTELGPAPLAETDGCAAVLTGRRVYVSYSGRSHLGVYDLDADAWWTLPSPLPDTTAIAADDAGLLYLVRGKLGRRLDPQDGSVQPIAPPPFDFGARGALGHHRGRLYGHRDSEPAWFLAYDPTTDRWSERAPLPRTAVGRSAIDPIAGDYFAPGASGSGVLLRHRIEDNAWHTEPLELVEGADAGAAWLPDPVPGIFLATTTDLARRVTATPFFAVAPFSARVEPAQSVEVDVPLDATRLYAGTYRGSIEISSNDPASRRVTVPLELRVTGAPRISIRPAALDFGEVFVGTAREIALTLANEGTAPLAVASIAADSAEVSADPAQLSVPPGESREVRVRYAPVGAGTLGATLAVESDDPQSPRATVALSGSAIDPPALALDPERLETTVVEGTRLARNLRLSNAGLGPLDFSIRVAPASASFVAVEPPEGRLAPGDALDVTVTFDAASAGLGVHAAALLLATNDPFRGSVEIPAALTVRGVPRIAIGRAPVVLESTLVFKNDTTLHALRAVVPPSGSGTLELTAVGDYGNPGETVTVAAEGVTIGQAGPGAADCGTLEATFPLAPASLSALASDGLVEIEVRNSSAVRAYCPQNRHGVRLRYVGSADRLDYGIVFLGASRELTLAIENLGTAALAIGRIASDTPEFTPAVPELVVAPGATASLDVAFEPSGVGTFEGRLIFESDDPAHPRIELPLAGGGAEAPAVDVVPAALDLAMPEGGSRIEPLALSNAGPGPLDFSITAVPPEATFLAPQIAFGTLAPFETLEIPVRIDAAELAVGSHAATLEILTNDPRKPRIVVPVSIEVLGAPDLIHVGENVTLESTADFSTQGALTRHTLSVRTAPHGEGRIEVVADGDYGQSIEFAFVSAEGAVIGSVGGVGADCIPAFGSFGLDAASLASLADDGTVELEVQNNINVDPGCTINAHTVRLVYRARADRLDFDTVFVGQSRRRSVTLSNEGHEPLEVLSISVEPGEFAALEHGLVLEPGASAPVHIDFSPLVAGSFAGTLTVTSNDPDTPRLEIPLAAIGAEPPALSVSSGAIERTLFEGDRQVAPLTLANSGASPLDFALELREPEGFEGGFTLFATDGGGGGLYTIDPTTAQAGFVGSMGIGVPALAVDPTTGVMYVGQGGGTAALYTVDPETAVIRLVGDTRLGEAAIAALDFDAAGELYASVNVVDGPGTGGDHLARIDTGTGTATSLGPFGNGIGTAGGPPGIAGIAFDPATGVLYGASAAHSSTVGPPALYRIDTETGEASFVARIVDATGQSVSGGVGSLQFLPDGVLLGGTGRDTGDLIRIDPSTGRYELVGHALAGPVGALALRKNPADLSFVDVSPVEGTVGPLGSLPVEVVFDARTLPPGTYRARLALRTNDPTHAQVEVPLSLAVIGVPDIAVAGESVVLESAQDYGGDGSTTTHDFALDRVAAGGATIELLVEGDYGAASESAELRIGDLTLGAVGNTGADCFGDSATFVLAARDFAEVAGGGSLSVDVVNTAPVGAICAVNRHTVRLRYPVPREGLEFGTVFVGHPRTVRLRIENHGRAELAISSFEPGPGEIAVAAEPTTIQPFGAIEVPVTFSPQAPGALVGELVIRSSDPDEPAVSLALSGEAIGAPVADIRPAALRAALPPRGVRPIERTVRLHNTGSSDLAWSAELVEVAPATLSWQELPKGDESANGSGAGLAAERRGGPDSFGYRFADSDGLDGPRFEWVDLSEDGAALELAGDDETSAPVPLGFDFPFYGRTFDEIHVSTNGWLSFSSDLASYSNAPSLPGTGSTVPENLLAPFWDDLDLRGARAIRYATHPSRFVVQYTDVGRFSSAARLTFQVVLHASGRIVFQYLSMSGTLDSATVGIQNGERTAGLLAAYNEDYVHDGLAVEFAPIAPWATVAPAAGLVAPGGFVDLAVELRSSDLDAGERGAVLLVRSNDPVRAQVSVPVRLRTATLALESFEIRPATLSAASRASTVGIVLELPRGFDPRDVVLATVRIDEVLALEPYPPVYGDDDGDGIEELHLRVDRRGLARLVGERETATIGISGEIDGQSWFAGAAEIRLLPAPQRGRPRR